MTQRCMRALYRPWAASFCFGCWPLRDPQARHAMMKLLFFLLFCCEILSSWVHFIHKAGHPVHFTILRSHFARKETNGIRTTCTAQWRCEYCRRLRVRACCQHISFRIILHLFLHLLLARSTSCSCSSNILFRASAAGCATARPGIPSLSHFFSAQTCRIPPLPKRVLCSSGCAGRRCRWRQRHRSCHAFGGNVSKTQLAAAATRITRHS